MEKVKFKTLFEFQEKSHIKAGEGQDTGEFKFFICSDIKVKFYNVSQFEGESLIFGTGGKASIHYCESPFSVSTDCVVAKPLLEKELCVKFYFYWFRQLGLNVLQLGFRGSGLQHISKKYINELELPFPDLPTQEKIVEKIEELFSELDKGIEELTTAKAKLKVYRQAVLKEAFEGTLIDVETATFNRIFIADMLVKDRKGMSTGPFGTMIKKNEHKTTGVPMLGIENIGKGKFKNKTKIFVTEEKAEELKGFKVFSGDIIISRSGTVGELCMVPEYMNNSLLSTNLMRVSLDDSIILPEYFVYLFQSKGVILEQVKELCKGSTRLFLKQTILKQIEFCIPTTEVQEVLLAEIESRLSICDKIESTIEESLVKAERLRQSILKEAFEGRLV